MSSIPVGVEVQDRPGGNWRPIAATRVRLTLPGGPPIIVEFFQRYEGAGVQVRTDGNLLLSPVAGSAVAVTTTEWP